MLGVKKALKIVSSPKAIIVVIITTIIIITIERTGICIIIPIIRAKHDQHTRFIFPSLKLKLFDANFLTNHQSLLRFHLFAN